jgi:plasmid stabilization system protein ParE
MRVKRWKGFESNLAYRVEIMDSALADAEQYVHFIQEEKQEPEAAERYFRGLVKAMLALQELPHRCPVIPEAEEFNLELRQAIYFPPDHLPCRQINEVSDDTARLPWFEERASIRGPSVRDQVSADR